MIGDETKTSMLSHEEVGDEEFSEGEEEGKDVNAGV